MLSMMILGFMVLCADVPDACCTEYVSLMSAVANVTVGAESVLRYLPPCPVDGYISRYVLRLSSRRFAIMPIGQNSTVKVGNEERETGYTGWRWRWKRRCGHHDSDGHTHATFMDMVFVSSIEESATKRICVRL